MKNERKQIVREFVNSGFNLTLVKRNSRENVTPNWTKTKLPLKTLLEWEGNFARVLDHNELVVDIDIKRGNGFDSWDRLLKDFDIPRNAFSPTVKTSSGGVHIYMKMNAEITGFSEIKKNLPEYPHIDFLSKGSCHLIPGSTVNGGTHEWAEGNFLGLYQRDCPDELARYLCYNPVPTKGRNKEPDGEVSESGIDSLTIFGTSSEDEGEEEAKRAFEHSGRFSEYSQLSYEEVWRKLKFIDPDVDYSDWVKVGFALYDWNREGVNGEGYRLWRLWSRRGSKFEINKPNFMRGLWKDFRKRHGRVSSDRRVTLGSVDHLSKKGLYDEEAAEVTRLQNLIERANEKAIHTDIIPSIGKRDLSDRSRRKIAYSIRDKLYDIDGFKTPLGEIQNKIRAGIAFSEDRGDLVELSFRKGIKDAPKWCDNWIFVNTHNAYMDFRTGLFHKAESFNLENGRYIPANEAGGKPSPVKYITDRGFIKKADMVFYNPCKKEKLFMHGNLKCVNSYDAGSVPEEEPIDEKGRAAIDRMIRHTRLTCGKKRSELFLDWLAWQVSRPGKKLRFCPLIQGFEGAGKGYFGRVLRACMGDRNVGIVSPDAVKSPYNGWAEGVAVNVLEELKIQGENRYEIVNAIKPLITDDAVQIHEKFVKRYMSINVTNYIAFTNFKDAIPMNDKSRRWWVIFSPFYDKEEMEIAVKKPLSRYFDILFGDLKKYSGQFRTWFLNREISSEFKKMKVAPRTAEMDTMVMEEDDRFPGLFEANELLNEGGCGFTKKVMSVTHFFEALNEKMRAEGGNPFDDYFDNTKKGNTEKGFFLKKLGFTTHKKRLRFGGKVCRIRVRGNYSDLRVEGELRDSERLACGAVKAESERLARFDEALSVGELFDSELFDSELF